MRVVVLLILTYYFLPFLSLLNLLITTLDNSMRGKKLIGGEWLQHDMRGFGNFMESNTGKNCIYIWLILDMLSSVIPNSVVYSEPVFSIKVIPWFLHCASLTAHNQMAAVKRNMWSNIIKMNLTEEEFLLAVVSCRGETQCVGNEHNVSSTRVAEFDFLTENLDSGCLTCAYSLWFSFKRFLYHLVS